MEYLQIWHKRPHGLKDELIRVWWSKVTVTVQIMVLAIIYMLIITIFHKNV